MKRHGIEPADIDMILISHLHGDHFGGLPFLFLEYMCESPPRKTSSRSRVRASSKSGPGSCSARCSRGRERDLERVRSKLRFVVLEPGVSSASARLACRDDSHAAYETLRCSLALKFALDGKTIVFSGDSGWTDELVPV